MKLDKLILQNFGSYKKLTHDFNNEGLSLVYGVTGSGKSTLFDGPMWILFGETSKNGSVDDIRAWNSPDSTTVGTLNVVLNGKQITIYRSRGKPSENDLYWLQSDDLTPNRGKDLNDTQRLLNGLLGFNGYIYSLGAYYNEFSPTGAFFTARATERRQLFESIADLSFTTTLAAKIDESKKIKVRYLKKCEQERSKVEVEIAQLKKFIDQSVLYKDKWESQKQCRICDIKTKKDTFEIKRQLKIKTIEDNRGVLLANSILKMTCEKCGHINTSNEESLVNIENSADRDIRLAQIELNPHEEQLKYAETEENPHSLFTGNSEVQLELSKATNSTLISEIDYEKQIINSLDQLTKLNELLRGELLINTVKNVQNDINNLLETHFDSEVRIEFVLQSKDKVDVLAQVSGNYCPYTQLSKGQRSLVKFAFAISVMTAVSNNCGVKFDTLFLDEPLDGADSILKNKAFGIFSMLLNKFHGVFIIDHNENLQNLFERKYLVELNSGVSSIKELE